MKIEDFRNCTKVVDCLLAYVHLLVYVVFKKILVVRFRDQIFKPLQISSQSDEN